MITYKVLKNCCVHFKYSWTCGDGCCSDTEYDYQELNAGTEIDMGLDYEQYAYGIIDTERYDCPIIPAYELDRLIEEKYIEQI